MLCFTFGAQLCKDSKNKGSCVLKDLPLTKRKRKEKDVPKVAHVDKSLHGSKQDHGLWVSKTMTFSTSQHSPETRSSKPCEE